MYFLHSFSSIIIQQAFPYPGNNLILGYREHMHVILF
jgi:hypothetical protein